MFDSALLTIASFVLFLAMSQANGKEETMLMQYPENLNLNGKYWCFELILCSLESKQVSVQLFVVKFCIVTSGQNVFNFKEYYLQEMSVHLSFTT